MKQINTFAASTYKIAFLYIVICFSNVLLKLVQCCGATPFTMKSARAFLKECFWPLYFIALSKLYKKNNMYVIQVRGLFFIGYLKLFWYGKNKQIQFENHAQSLKFASKFWFRWYARFICYLMNKQSEKQYHFRHFTVVKYLPPTK